MKQTELDSQFLTVEDVLVIHQDQVSRYGGSSGVRDRGLLESALAQPSSRFDGQLLHPDLHTQAAAYLFHLVKNHPFQDGNKRTALAAALVFLDLHGLELDGALDEEDSMSGQTSLERWVLQVVAGDLGKIELADLLRKHTRPI